MDKIQHSFVDVRGLKIHFAEIGTGPSVVFLHGFPEIWYSWRHQLLATAAAGFCAIAPDFRGYGLSEQPQEPHKTTFKDLVDDLAVFLDNLKLQKILLVGKDFGATIVHRFALLHPHRLAAIVTMGVPFIPAPFPIEQLPQGLYMLRWQEPGRAEKDFGRFTVKTVIKNIYILFSGSELPVAAEDEEVMDMVDPSTPLPSWFTNHDLDQYTDLYTKSGFQTALQVPYRSWIEGYGVDEPKLEVPALLIMGDKDYAMKFAGIEDYVRSGVVKKYVPDLEVVFVADGTHFVQEQFPDEVNQILTKFIKKLGSY